MSVSDEDLVGFALGALEPAEHSRVAAALQANPILRERLAEIKAALTPLDEIFEEDSAPPPGLVEQTLARIAEEPLPESFSEPRLVRETGSTSPHADRIRPSNGGLEFEESKTGFRFWDSIALSASFLLLASLFFPALLNGRSHARRVECSHNLSSLASLLTQYASLATDGRIPEVPNNGYRNFAGIYAIQLNDAHLLENSNQLWCPSMVSFSPDCQLVLPSDERLRTATAGELALFRSWVGGSYAYNLGVVDGRRLKAPRYLGRTQFAWLGDAPIITGADNSPIFSRIHESHLSASTNPATMSASQWWTIMGNLEPDCDEGRCNGRMTWLSHEGRGFNIVFEDGHVAFISLRGISPEGLAPYLNHAGSLEAGVEPNDSALGPSPFSPWTLSPAISRSAR
jgi:hypothetical protein